MSSRRSLLKAFLSTTVGASLISVFYPVVRFLIPPERRESASLSVDAGKAAALAPNSGRVIKFGTQPAIVVRTPGGELKAFSAVCTHLNCTVQYRSDLQEIYCACHGGVYNLNGVPVAGPPPRPLEEYTVKEQGGDIIVSRVS